MSYNIEKQIFNYNNIANIMIIIIIIFIIFIFTYMYIYSTESFTSNTSKKSHSSGGRINYPSNQQNQSSGGRINYSSNQQNYKQMNINKNNTDTSKHGTVYNHTEPNKNWAKNGDPKYLYRNNDSTNDKYYKKNHIYHNKYHDYDNKYYWYDGSRYYYYPYWWYDSPYYYNMPKFSCSKCGNKSEKSCSNCVNCGWCINRGVGECTPGDINGPYFREDCQQWWY